MFLNKQNQVHTFSPSSDLLLCAHEREIRQTKKVILQNILIISEKPCPERKNIFNTIKTFLEHVKKNRTECLLYAPEAKINSVY
jgi:hypothetical protein